MPVYELNIKIYGQQTIYFCAKNTVHCVKSARIPSVSGPYFLSFGLNTDQKNSEYGPFSSSCTHFIYGNILARYFVY